MNHQFVLKLLFARQLNIETQLRIFALNARLLTLNAQFAKKKNALSATRDSSSKTASAQRLLSTLAVRKSKAVFVCPESTGLG